MKIPGENASEYPVPMTPITFFASPELHARLKAQGQSEHTSISEVCRRVLTRVPLTKTEAFAFIEKWSDGGKMWPEDVWLYFNEPERKMKCATQTK